MELWFTLSLLALALWGFTGLTQKLATNHVSAELSYAFYVAGFLPIMAVLLFQRETTWTLSPRDWLVTLTAGVFLGGGTLTSFMAYRLGGKASVVTLIAGLYPVVTVALAVPILGERIGWREGIGIALAVAAGIALTCEGGPAEEA